MRRRIFFLFLIFLCFLCSCLYIVFVKENRPRNDRDHQKSAGSEKNHFFFLLVFFEIYWTSHPWAWSNGANGLVINFSDVEHQLQLNVCCMLNYLRLAIAITIDRVVIWPTYKIILLFVTLLVQIAIERFCFWFFSFFFLGQSCDCRTNFELFFFSHCKQILNVYCCLVLFCPAPYLSHPVPSRSVLFCTVLLCAVRLITLCSISFTLFTFHKLCLNHLTICFEYSLYRIQFLMGSNLM